MSASYSMCTVPEHREPLIHEWQCEKQCRNCDAPWWQCPICEPVAPEFCPPCSQMACPICGEACPGVDPGDEVCAECQPSLAAYDRWAREGRPTREIGRPDASRQRSGSQASTAGHCAVCVVLALCPDPEPNAGPLPSNEAHTCTAGSGGRAVTGPGCAPLVAPVGHDVLLPEAIRRAHWLTRHRRAVLLHHYWLDTPWTAAAVAEARRLAPFSLAPILLETHR